MVNSDLQKVQQIVAEYNDFINWIELTDEIKFPLEFPPDLTTVLQGLRTVDGIFYRTDPIRHMQYMCWRLYDQCKKYCITGNIIHFVNCQELLKILNMTITKWEKMEAIKEI